MGILARKIIRKHPKSEKEQYYYSRVSAGRVDTLELAKEMSITAGQSVGAIIGLLQDMHDIALNYLSMGYSVNLAPVGILQTKINCKGVDNKIDFSTDQIKKVNVHLLPSVPFKSDFKLTNVNIVNADSKFVEYEPKPNLPS